MTTCTDSASEPIGTNSAKALDCNARTIDQFANSNAGTQINRVGKTGDTLTGIRNKADAAIAAAGYSDLGLYTSNPRIETLNQFVRFVRGGETETYKAKLSTTLPYDIDSAATPSPLNDTNLELFSTDLAFGKNFITNPQFKITSGTVIDSTPSDHAAGTQLRQGWFAQTAIVGIKDVGGLLNATSGVMYFDIPKNGVLTDLTEFTASFASKSLNPITTGISFTPIASAFRVTIDLAIASDMFSAKFETGNKATQHEVEDGAGVNPYTMTLAQAISNPYAKEGDYKEISDRGNGKFQYTTGQAANGDSIIDHIDLALQIMLVDQAEETLMSWLGNSSTSLQSALDSGSTRLNLGVGERTLASPLVIDRFDELTSNINPYRVTGNGVVTVNASVTPLVLKPFNLGGKISNLSIRFSGVPSDNLSAAIDMNVGDTEVQTAGIGQQISNVFGIGYRIGINTSGWCWQSTFDRVVMEKCRTGFRVRAGSSNIITYRQCIALLGSDSTQSPLESIGFDFEGADSIMLDNSASEANYTNCKFKNSIVTFNTFYSESAGFVDFELNDTVLNGTYLKILPTANRFDFNSAFRNVIGYLKSYVKIDHVLVSGEVELVNVFDLAIKSDIDIGFLQTKTLDGGALFSSLWSPSKTAPRSVGLENNVGDRWMLVRDTTNPSLMIPEVELSDFSGTFSFNCVKRDSTMQDFLVVGARQIIPQGNRIWSGVRWRYEKSVEAPKLYDETSLWSNKSLLAGEFSIYEAVNNGSGNATATIMDEGAIDGDTLTVVASIRGSALTVTINADGGGVLVVLTQGQQYTFKRTSAGWI